MYQDSQEPPETLGRFQLISKIASGGMGEIHLARLRGEGGFEKLIVLKLLLPELVADERFVAMFLDEARITAKLSHPNVCEIYELGRADNRYFIAMPYLRGIPMSRLIVDGGAETRLVAALLAQACDGLHHAHELTDSDGQTLGVVHRDVSPSNLFVTVDGVVKVLDFGIAKARGATTTTAKNEIKGKYAYMSPEQLRGEALDRRSDVFSLGIVAHEVLTGTRLFRRPSDYLAAKAILEEPIPTARSIRRDLPEALSAAVDRALSRDPTQRFATALQLRDAIAAAVAPLGGALSTSEAASLLRARFAAQLRESESIYERATEIAHRTDIETDASTNRFATTATRALRPGSSPSRWRRALPWVLGVSVAGAAVGAFWVSSDGASETDRATSSIAFDAGPVADAEAVAMRGPFDARPKPLVRTAPADARLRRKPTKTPPKQLARPGYLSIDSDPYATIYIDGKRVGVTPLIRRAVPAGKHRIRAVTRSGKSRTFKVTIRAGRAAPPQQLRW